MTSPTIKIPPEDWIIRAEAHAARVGPFAEAFVKRRDLKQKHPVHDFLFTYYNCSPLKLKQWVPSFEEELVVTAELLNAYPWLRATAQTPSSIREVSKEGFEPLGLKSDWFSLKGAILSLNREKLNANTVELATFVRDLCRNILQRAPRFGCFGLHEWAMVYKLSPESIRHSGYRLRLSPEAIASFVESQSICCSHYDAYRFFTSDAHPLNTLRPTLETRSQMEQAGCLHANMDLYKWSVKLWPWIGSDFIAKTFLLAVEIRELDMRASPYDLFKEGYAPICIETEEGRKQYQKEQQSFATRAAPLRKELLSFCERFIAFLQN